MIEINTSKKYNPKVFLMPCIKFSFFQMLSCKMLKLDHVDFFHYMLCKSICKNLPKFGTWQNLIKDCVEIYGHLYWMAHVLIRKENNQ